MKTNNTKWNILLRILAVLVFVALLTAMLIAMTRAGTSVIMKVAWINFGVYISAMLFIKDKNRRIRIIWTIISVILLATATLIETGSW